MLAQFKRDYIDKLRLDSNIKSIEELVTQVQWVNGFTGEEHIHYVDLTITNKDGVVEHVDFAVDAFPLTKYIYAQNQLGNWKLLTINPNPISW